MRHPFVVRLLFMLAIVSLFMSCEPGHHTNPTDNANVQGTWNASITFQSCTPTDVCTTAGFTAGTSVNAVMVLTQNDTQVQGTYTYQNNAGINAPVSGGVSGNQLTLTGLVTTSFGSLTVNVVGTVSGNNLPVSVTHVVTLPSGSTGNVTGGGIFTLQQQAM